MNFFQKLKKFFQGCAKFFKKHPFWAFGILAALIVAGVFTGGMIFAVPAVFAGFAIAGACVASLLTFCGLTFGGAGLASCGSNGVNEDGNPYHNSNSNCGSIGFVLGIVGGICVGFAVSLNPIAGVVFCGIGLVTGLGALFGALATAIKKCCTNSTTPAPSSGVATSNTKPASPHSPTPSNGATRAIISAGINIQAASSASSAAPVPTAINSSTANNSSTVVNDPAFLVAAAGGANPTKARLSI
jgi:hypothetical protein